MNTLDRMTIEEVGHILPDKDDIHKLKKDEPIFRIVVDTKPQKTDDLVNVEIALRQCDRTGFFRK